MAVPTAHSGLNLTPFRWRIRLLRLWRCAAIGGSIGAGVAVVMALLDLFSVVYFKDWMLATPILIGVMAGMVKALTEQLSDVAVARSLDRRSSLNDRLTTAIEVPDAQGGFSEALHKDVIEHLGGLRPSVLYPVKPGRWHGALLGLAVLAAGIYIYGNSTFFLSTQAKQDAADQKQEAAAVRAIAKPILDEAATPNATPEEKDLARRIDKFASDLEKARMSKQEALMRANDLAEQAQKLEAGRAAQLGLSIQSAQTAAGDLQKMDSNASLEQSSDMKMTEQEKSLASQIASMEQQLAAAQSSKSPMSAAERSALESKLAAMKDQLKQIQLSERAQEMMRKLEANPDYQEAEKLLAKLAAAQSAEQSGQQSPMTQEQMQEAADRLEQLAKQLDTDAKMADYAKALLQAARDARKAAAGEMGLMSAFGMDGGPHMNGPSGPGNDWDRGGNSPNHIPLDDKSSLLHVKFTTKMTTSQLGKTGPESYTEVLGPSTPSGSSGIPYQAVLPKYEKSAETALNKEDVPPQLRTKVRDYFDSLRK